MTFVGHIGATLMGGETLRRCSSSSGLAAVAATSDDDGDMVFVSASDDDDVSRVQRFIESSKIENNDIAK